MGIFQSDTWIREAISLGLEDIRKDNWILDDILSDFTSSQYLKPKYGNQVKSAREWFLANKIEINMGMRTDTDRLPCVTISLGSSNEKPEMKTMADQSTDTITLLPNYIGKPIPYVIKPFAVTAYDPNTGYVTVDPSVADLPGVSVGMILVNPTNGNGYPINDITPDGLQIAVSLSFQLGNYGIVPKFQYYEARIEHTWMQETYTIGCHAHGDPQTLLWLHSIVLYSLFRYRETLLEANGFAESVFSSSDLMQNANYTGPGGEMAFTRQISLTGQVEQSWIKAPRRFVEDVELQATTPDGLTGGIRIISNSNSSDFLDNSTQTWITETEEQESEDF